MDALKPIYWVVSEEPFLLQRANEALWTRARKQQFTKYYYDSRLSFEWSALIDHQQARDLFNPRTWIHLLWVDPKMTAEIETTLETYLNQAHPECCLLLNSPKLSSSFQQLTLFKKIQSFGEIQQIPALTLAQFPSFLKQEAHRLNLQLTPEALSYLCLQHEGHALSALQALERLSLLGHTQINLPMVQQDAACGRRYTVFEVIDRLLAGDPQALRMCADLRLEGQELLPFLGAVFKMADELCRLEQQNTRGIWPKRLALLQQTLKRLNTSVSLDRFYIQLQAIDTLIKTHQSPLAWQQFERLLETLL